MAIITVIKSALPGASLFYAGTPVHLNTSYITLTVSFNVLMTGAICFRLLSMRNKLRTVLNHDTASMYTGVMAILVESAAPLTIFGIAFVIPYATSSDLELAFAQVWGAFLVRAFFAFSKCSASNDVSVYFSAAHHFTRRHGRCLVNRNNSPDKHTCYLCYAKRKR